MAPVVVTGHWTWPGYNFVNDTAPNFVYADLLSRQGMTLPGAIDSTTAVIQAAPINLGYPVGSPRAARHSPAADRCGPPRRLSPDHRRVAALAAMAMAQLARRAGLCFARRRRRRPAGRRRAPVPLWAARVDQGGVGGSAHGHGRGPCAGALDRELSIRLAVLIALCAAALLHVFSAVGAAYALVLGVLLLAVALAGGPGRGAVGRLAGAGVAIGVLAVAVNLSDVTSFAKHAGDTFASEGGASTAYLGHLLRPLPRSGRRDLVLARLSRARAAAVREREHDRRHRNRRSLRSRASCWSCAGDGRPGFCC